MAEERARRRIFLEGQLVCLSLVSLRSRSYRVSTYLLVVKSGCHQKTSRANELALLRGAAPGRPDDDDEPVEPQRRDLSWQAGRSAVAPKRARKREKEAKSPTSHQMMMAAQYNQPEGEGEQHRDSCRCFQVYMWE